MNAPLSLWESNVDFFSGLSHLPLPTGHHHFFFFFNFWIKHWHSLFNYEAPSIAEMCLLKAGKKNCFSQPVVPSFSVAGEPQQDGPNEKHSRRVCGGIRGARTPSEPQREQAFSIPSLQSAGYASHSFLLRWERRGGDDCTVQTACGALIRSAAPVHGSLAWPAEEEGSIAQAMSTVWLLMGADMNYLLQFEPYVSLPWTSLFLRSLGELPLSYDSFCKYSTGHSPTHVSAELCCSEEATHWSSGTLPFH